MSSSISATADLCEAQATGNGLEPVLLAELTRSDVGAEAAAAGQPGSSWTDEKLRQLFQLKTFVEDRYRCVQVGITIY